jgi:hypothetical protein
MKIRKATDPQLPSPVSEEAAGIRGLAGVDQHHHSDEHI